MTWRDHFVLACLAVALALGCIALATGSKIALYGVLGAWVMS